jgi:formylglycine-generating enzyme required for sulfatase activity/predicted Ser/Thr protein kinase
VQGGEARTFGRFVIRRELGRGANGVVLDAFDPQTGRSVALKLLRQGEQAPYEQVERLRREAEALARVRHPNVVAVYEAGSRDGFHYLVLEPIQGVPLSEVFRKLPLERRLDLVEQIARGLHAAHLVGIVHRDVKPGNVLVDQDGRARIIDFGLARLAGASVALTETGGLVGTPSYMAPEQARGDADAIGPWTDVYALGALLFEALTGEVIYAQALALPDVLRLLESDARSPSPRDRVPEVSRSLDAVCAHALEKDAKRRTSSAAGFADALRAARGDRGERPRPWPAAVAFILALGFVGGVALASLLARPAAPPPPVALPPSPPPPPATDVTPPWYALLPVNERPPLPLPGGVAFESSAGEYRNAKDGSVLVWVAPGVFIMGSDGEEPREGPAHEVRLSGFFVGKYEVSIAQFARFMEATRHVTTAEKRGSARVLTVGGEMEAPGATWRDPDGTGTPADERFPASQVSWLDAQAYVEWAGLSLPTEAQWEKAASWDPRSRKARRYAWGDFLPGANTPRVGNVLDESFRRRWPNPAGFPGYDDGYVKVAPVGSFPAGASVYGALDMTGNVSEWCLDFYDESFYRSSPLDDPVCLKGDLRSVRGGGFSYGPTPSRTHRRGATSPDTVGENIGFRVVLNPR